VVADLDVAYSRAWTGFWGREEAKVFYGIDCDPEGVSG